MTDRYAGSPAQDAESLTSKTRCDYRTLGRPVITGFENVAKASFAATRNVNEAQALVAHGGALWSTLGKSAAAAIESSFS